MKTEIELHHVVHAVLRSDYDAAEASIEIVREEESAGDAVVAVAFRTRAGDHRRGFLSVSRDREGVWRPSGGWCGGLGTGESDGVFVTYGGWGSSGSRNHAVFGGWVADPSAFSARLIDPMTRRVLTDQVTNEVVIFMDPRELPLRYARIELLDQNQSVLRAAPAQRAARG